MMDHGRSWSGNERNCVYLNRGAETFADISGISGCDFPDDARAVASCDWDGDGDQDLWIRNRSAPQLRFMENQSNHPAQSLSLQLRGKHCNGAAIGARVEFSVDENRWVRMVECGSGYLSQSDSRISFAWPGASKTVKTVITWPCGRIQDLGMLSRGFSYQVEEGKTLTRVPFSVRRLPKKSGALQVQEASGEAVFLRTPLALPPSIRRSAFPGPKPAGSTLLIFWAEWCSLCRSEIQELAAAKTQWSAAGLHVVLLNLDPVQKRREAFQFVQPLAKASGMKAQFLSPSLQRVLGCVKSHILGGDEGVPLPFGMIVNEGELIEAVTLGKAGVESLMHLVQQVARTGSHPSSRSHLGGRYFAQQPRDLKALAAALSAVGAKSDARFYQKLSNSRK